MRRRGFIGMLAACAVGAPLAKRMLPDRIANARRAFAAFVARARLPYEKPRAEQLFGYPVHYVDAGGFRVPDEYREELLKVIRERCHVVSLAEDRAMLRQHTIDQMADALENRTPQLVKAVEEEHG